MFDVGFSEILVIMLVSLVVIGPERLPKVARTLGHLWGRVQRYVNTVKQDISSSVELEELREMERKVKAEADALQHSVQQTSNDIDHEMRQMERDLELPAKEVKKIASTANGSTLPPNQA
jgi:sec-independent protein translocase protein TatB